MRRWLLLIGTVFIVIGFYEMVNPGLIGVPAADTILILAGLSAAIAGAVRARAAVKIERIEHPTENVERASPVPVPGDDVDEHLHWALPPHQYVRDRRLLRRRVYDLAIGAMTTFQGMTEDEAQETLREGTWTDDPDAAAFLGVIAPELTTRERLRRYISDHHWLERRVHRSLSELSVLVPWETPPVPEPASSSGFRFSDVTAGVRERMGNETRTRHWRGISAIPLVGIGLGIMLEFGSLVLAGAIGIGYLAYARTGSAPAPTVEIDRRLSTDEPEPGEPVTVTLTVQNTGDGWLPDLRVIDTVPDALDVIEGRPRRSVTIRPDGEAELRYRVRARSGTHEWETVTLISRSLNGSFERVETIEVSNEIVSVPFPEPVRARVPLKRTGSIAAGQLPTDRPGEGVAFETIREYRAGDRRTRIDWRRYARTDELSTVEFREERATSVVIVIDARQESFVAPAQDRPHSVQRAVGAADRLALTLHRDGHRVGVASMATDPLWVRPSAARTIAMEIRDQLATHPSLAAVPPEDDQFRLFQWISWLDARMPDEAQILLLSPLVDDLLIHGVVRLQARGYPVTILSPDATSTETMGRYLATLERRLRMTKLQRRGVRTVDWPADQPIDTALAALANGWSG